MRESLHCGIPSSSCAVCRSRGFWNTSSGEWRHPEPDEKRLAAEDLAQLACYLPCWQKHAIPWRRLAQTCSSVFREDGSCQAHGRQPVVGVGCGLEVWRAYTFKRVPQWRRTWPRWVTPLGVAQLHQRQSRVVMEDSRKCFVKKLSPTSRLTTFARWRPSGDSMS